MEVLPERGQGDDTSDDGRVPAEGHGAEAGGEGEEVDAPPVDFGWVVGHWQRTSAG